MKNGINKTVRCEFEIKTKTKIFEKNPTRGGTPANESRQRDITLVKMFVDPRLEKENNVLKFDPTDWRIVVNIKKDVML